MLRLAGRSEGIHSLLAVLLAELRSVRRLARTWVFLGLGIGVVGAAYGYYSYLHATISSASIAYGNTLPRFTTAYLNSYVLWFFMAAMVFLAFDFRQRDERERMAEAVDSRRLSNLALVGGRLCAVVLAVCLPLFGVLLLVQAVGTIGRAVGWWVDPIEPVATFIFFFVDAVPAFTLWCAFVLLLAAGVRNRLVVAGAALALLGVHMWAFAFVPAYLLPVVSLLYIHDNWASDLAPRLPDLGTFLHRTSMLMLAAAFVVWAAGLYKRPDSVTRRRRLLVGILPAALATAGIGIALLRCIEGMHVRDTWLATHRAVADEPTPSVAHLAGRIAIDPGEELDIDVEMLVEAGPADLSTLLFSFNPGLEISELHVDNQPTPFRHEQGLLTVALPRPLALGTRATVTLRAAGIPDADFAYLDSMVDWRRESSRNAILWQGTAGGIFEKRYVALMPGLRWLPVPGPNLDDARRGHAPTMDLTVGVPPGWLVAGPGRREELGSGRFRFRPKAAVPMVGLFASRFERRATQIGELELELLLHPAHLRNLDYYADGADEIVKTRLAEIFGDADELGIPYPYRGFSAVEVPAHLRGYGGGHWLDARMALPGLLLVKEHGFPYSNVWRFNDANLFSRFPGGFEGAKAQWLEFAFSNPFNAGSGTRSLVRNLLTFQTTAVGPGSHALDYVTEELARQLFSLQPTFRGMSTMYSGHNSDTDAGFGSTVAQIIRRFGDTQGAGSTGFEPFYYVPPAVAERVLRTSLAEPDFEPDPRIAIAAFGLRAQAVVRSIFDGLGRDGTGALLAELRRDRDATYDAAEFAEAAAAAGADIDRLVGDWLSDTALPGFIASPGTVARIDDDGEGRPRYQIRAHVRNGERTPGLVQMSWGYTPQSPRSDPIRIDGNSSVEIGMVGAEPPELLLLEPYLALNRVPFRIEIVDGDPQAGAGDPFVGVRPSNWTPPPPKGIVIDDLDPRFSVEHRGENRHLVGTATNRASTEYDHGLPLWSRRPGEWTRADIASAWGRYRHTAAGAVAGDGGQVGVFAADLPAPGRWRLDYHVPRRHSMGRGVFPSFGLLGTITLVLVAEGDETAIVFDGAEAAVGWNKVGEYELPAATVRLEISSETDGEMVIADAIRWVPLD